MSASPAQSEPSRPISAGTTLTLSLAGSLVIAAFSAGITFAVVTRLQQDVVDVRAQQVAQANALHTTELCQERADAVLAGIRSDVSEMNGMLQGSRGHAACALPRPPVMLLMGDRTSRQLSTPRTWWPRTQALATREPVAVP
ncbi:hypothetical protein G4177_14680 [Corallococcus sp. ZKHCc1 1396]|uniref:Uncharacterized protein n=1 Tax=Corallococcus soli TaxID=2710757 RepID=A0ABR9PND1_9BACT|nr:hypothetical protein [Corallococcus soli]MBE4749410.1 hypothetical protein [Corallococcus soli]